MILGAEFEYHTLQVKKSHGLPKLKDEMSDLIKPWRLLSSKLIVKDQWINLRADRCQKDDGGIVEPFYVKEEPEWVCLFALTRDNEVILTTEYRHGAAVLGTGLPGGGVEKSDASPLAAAMRELKEETGYTSDDVTALGAHYANWANQDNCIHYFLVENAEKTDVQALDPNEDIAVTTLPFSEVMTGDILRQSFHLACVHLVVRHKRTALEHFS